MSELDLAIDFANCCFATSLKHLPVTLTHSNLYIVKVRFEEVKRKINNTYYYVILKS